MHRLISHEGYGPCIHKSEPVFLVAHTIEIQAVVKRGIYVVTRFVAFAWLVARS